MASNNNRQLRIDVVDSVIEDVDSEIKILDHLSSSYDIYVAQGKTHLELKMYEEAIHNFDSATKIKPSEPDNWNSKGCALTGLGKYEQAIECYDKALEIDPNYAYTWYNRASCNIKMGNIDSVFLDLEKAIQIGKREYIELAKQDEDFESIRNDNHFKALVSYLLQF